MLVSLIVSLCSIVHQLKKCFAFWDLQVANLLGQVFDLVLALVIVGRRLDLEPLIVLREPLQSKVAKSRESVGQDTIVVVQGDAS